MMKVPTTVFTAIAAFTTLMAGMASADIRVWFDELTLEDMSCGWREPKKNKSVEGNPLQIGSKTFERGVGTHAKSVVAYRVDGKAIAFDADVGIDAEVLVDGPSIASVKFIVKADARTVAETEVLRDNTESVHLHADLAGAQFVELEVCDVGDTIDKDHADWANAYFTMKDGARPAKAVPEQLGILTPPPSAAPRINGAKVFGVRPGHPILWRLPVTGERPVRLSATGLPDGATSRIPSGKCLRASRGRLDSGRMRILARGTIPTC